MGVIWLDVIQPGTFMKTAVAVENIDYFMKYVKFIYLHFLFIQLS